MNIRGGLGAQKSNSALGIKMPRSCPDQYTSYEHDGPLLSVRALMPSFREIDRNLMLNDVKRTKDHTLPYSFVILTSSIIRF